MTHTRNNEGVCSAYTTISISEGVIQEIDVPGGCNGNLKGMCTLLRGREAREAMSLLEGITCGEKDTSCPNEISKCIREALGITQETEAS